jgi:hypothetical protein
MSVKQHTLKTTKNSLKEKGLSEYIFVVSIDKKNSFAIVEDKEFGKYRVDLKAFAPKTKFPLHKDRKFKNRKEAIVKKLVGTTINSNLILDVFYGPDRGYKNRSFYLEYQSPCGHIMIATYAYITKHKKTLVCMSCSSTEHGERKKIDGVLKKRTTTYIHWQRIKKTLPEKYHDFAVFKAEAGEKPYKRAELRILNDSLIWVPLESTIDRELNLIAQSLRSAFRHSEYYKKCLENARVETEEGPRYRCAACNLLFPRKYVQVDHIDPVSDVNGNSLTKENLIDRVWTEKIQVLDRKCHSKKTALENKIRKENKKSKEEAAERRKSRAKRNS